MSLSVNFGCYILEGGRSYQEDRIIAYKDNEDYLFAIFDGHGGTIVSNYLKNSFYSELKKHPKIKSQPILSIQETWLSLEELCYKECSNIEKEENRKSFPLDGSTATVCYITNNSAYITNCGDSAAYAFFQNKSDSIKLTEDHGTANDSEVKRCERAGGHLLNQKLSMPQSFPFCCFSEKVSIGKPRVYPGGLLVTRSFGDFCAKKEFLGGKKNVVIANHGEIKYINFLSRSFESIDSKVEYLVLGSDGVWDVLSAQNVQTIINNNSSLKSSDSILQSLTSNPEVSFKRSQSFSKVIPEGNKGLKVNNRIRDILSKGYVEVNNISDFDESLMDLSQKICEGAVNSPNWKELGSNADNTSCIVIQIRFQK